jgi:hypothetical protein
VLARAVGGAAFAKAWRPKPAAAVFTKLYHRRGQVPVGWLTDALQGRLTCDSADAVDRAVDFFTDVMSTQGQAAFAAGRAILPETPSAADLMAFDVSGLLLEESQKPADELTTFCEAALSPEGAWCHHKHLWTAPNGRCMPSWLRRGSGIAGTSRRRWKRSWRICGGHAVGVRCG